ncbi:MAG TPA: PEP-CTERM sorting domain-containing protein [Rhodanobacter sp.]|nr:PEP-CTERM sorting domain-containing protein [Rhodanobacter sp.]
MSSKHLLRSIALAFGLTPSGAVLANPINILWYTGGIVAGGSSISDYGTAVSDLAALAPTSPGSNTWNVTFWNSGPIPSGSFNVMVIASPEGFWSTYPSYTALQTALTGGSVTYGNRLMLTGQDADWHYVNSPGPSTFDGPQGFLLDSINWAGSGTGMGLVALGMTGTGTCGDPQFGLSGYGSDCNSTDNVQIPAAYAGFPINTGLTSTGLSNWGTSAHAAFFSLDLTKWTGINMDGTDSCSAAPGDCYVTIVSAATGGGGIGGTTTTVPEPAELGMFGLGLLLIGLFASRRRMA